MASSHYDDLLKKFLIQYRETKTFDRNALISVVRKNLNGMCAYVTNSIDIPTLVDTILANPDLQSECDKAAPSLVKIKKLIYTIFKTTIVAVDFD